jgi:hypothetical protein
MFEEIRNKTHEKARLVQDVMDEHDIFADAYAFVHAGRYVVAVDIDGHWRDEHELADKLVAELGGKLLCEDIEKRNGTGWYASTHYYEF